MKSRKLLIPVIILGICMLSACGESSPKEEQIQQDLNTEIVNHKPFLTVDAYTIEQSLTNEDTYSATIAVNASSEYAQFDMQAEVEYVKFDQGWDITNCVWTENGHTVVAYPDTDTMTEILNSNEKIIDLELDSQTCTDISENADSLSCTGEINEEVNQYLSREGEVVSDWSYDPENDSWIIGEVQKSINYQLKNAEGTWPSIYSDYGATTITISNITDTGLDISCDTYKTDTIHVEMVENPVFGNIEYHGVPGSEITFWSEDEMLTSKSENVTVYISGSETGISVWFYIGTYADIANIWKL